MKSTRKLIPAIVMLLVSAIVLSTASYAWFSQNALVRAQGMNVQAKVSSSIFISAADQKKFGSTANALDPETQKLYPTSTADLLNWFSAVGMSDIDYQNMADYFDRVPDDRLNEYVAIFEFDMYTTTEKTEELFVSELLITRAGGTDYLIDALRIVCALRHDTGERLDTDEIDQAATAAALAGGAPVGTVIYVQVPVYTWTYVYYTGNSNGTDYNVYYVYDLERYTDDKYTLSFDINNQAAIDTAAANQAFWSAEQSSDFEQSIWDSLYKDVRGAWDGTIPNPDYDVMVVEGTDKYHAAKNTDGDKLTSKFNTKVGLTSENPDCYVYVDGATVVKRDADNRPIYVEVTGENYPGGFPEELKGGSSTYDGNKIEKAEKVQYVASSYRYNTLTSNWEKYGGLDAAGEEIWNLTEETVDFTSGNAGDQPTATFKTVTLGDTVFGKNGAPIKTADAGPSATSGTGLILGGTLIGHDFTNPNGSQGARVDDGKGKPMIDGASGFSPENADRLFIYVWYEGQDIDTNTINYSNANLNIAIEFTTIDNLGTTITVKNS